MKIRAFNIPEVSTYKDFLQEVLAAYKKQRTEDATFHYLCFFTKARLVILQPQYKERLLDDINKATRYATNYNPSIALNMWCRHNTNLDYSSSFKAVRIEFLKQLIAANTTKDQESSKS